MALPPFVQPDLETWLQRFIFSTSIRPRYSETDAFGHVNNVSYFIYFEQGRLDYFRHLGLLNNWSETEENESFPVVADLACHYLAELFFEESVRLFVRTARIGRTSLELEYALQREHDDVLIAIGRGRLVNVDLKVKKPVPFPEKVAATIRGYDTGL